MLSFWRQSCYRDAKQTSARSVRWLGKVIEDGKNYQRDSLAPTFKVKGTKEKLTVAINHFKSKGSGVLGKMLVPVEQGGQGGVDADKVHVRTRVAAAAALGEAPDGIKGHKVILGDAELPVRHGRPNAGTDGLPLKKYGKQIKAARNTYIDGVEQFGDSGAGNYWTTATLMLWLKSTQTAGATHTMMKSVPWIICWSVTAWRWFIDATDWHINGGESTLFRPTTRFKVTYLSTKITSVHRIRSYCSWSYDGQFICFRCTDVIVWLSNVASSQSSDIVNCASWQIQIQVTESYL